MTLEVAARGLKVFTSYKLKTPWIGQLNAFCTKIMSIVINLFTVCKALFGIFMTEGLDSGNFKTLRSQIELYLRHAVLVAWILSCFVVQRHEITHNRDKPFRCPKCDYKCSTSSDLKRHKRIHSDGEPFSCKCARLDF